jgi:hypothetical protein
VITLPARAAGDGTAHRRDGSQPMMNQAIVTESAFSVAASPAGPGVAVTGFATVNAARRASEGFSRPAGQGRHRRHRRPVTARSELAAASRTSSYWSQSVIANRSPSVQDGSIWRSRASLGNLLPGCRDGIMRALPSSHAYFLAICYCY